MADNWEDAWDDDGNEIVAQNADQWDDEDKGFGDVKESWDDEDVEKPKKAPAPKKPAPKGKGKKGATPAAKPAAPMTAAELAAEKKRMALLEIAADEKNITDLIGGADRMLLTMKPESETDFLKYASLISDKITENESSAHYLFFLKDLLRKTTPSLSVDQLIELGTLIEVLKKEKTAIDKKKPKKKAKGPGVKIAIKSKDLFDAEEGQYVNNDDEYDMFS